MSKNLNDKYYQECDTDRRMVVEELAKQVLQTIQGCNIRFATWSLSKRDSNVVSFRCPGIRIYITKEYYDDIGLFVLVDAEIYHFINITRNDFNNGNGKWKQFGSLSEPDIFNRIISYIKEQKDIYEHTIIN